MTRNYTPSSERIFWPSAPIWRSFWKTLAGAWLSGSIETLFFETLKDITKTAPLPLLSVVFEALQTIPDWREMSDTLAQNSKHLVSVADASKVQTFDAVETRAFIEKLIMSADPEQKRSTANGTSRKVSAKSAGKGKPSQVKAAKTSKPKAKSAVMAESLGTASKLDAMQPVRDLDRMLPKPKTVDILFGVQVISLSVRTICKAYISGWKMAHETFPKRFIFGIDAVGEGATDTIETPISAVPILTLILEMVDLACATFAEAMKMAMLREILIEKWVKAVRYPG